MKQIWCLYVLIWVTISASQGQSFSRQDSLRGSLNAWRNCYDVTYYDLNIQVDPDKKTISGFNTIHYQVLQDFDQIQVDLFATMKLEKIVFEGKNLNFKREGNAVFVKFPRKQTRGQKGFIQVYYAGKPRIAPNAPWDGGFSWNKDSQGNHFMGVSCEGDGASLWWPNKDHLSEEPDSMQISCTVPTGLMCVANGNLRKEEKLNDQFTKFTWFVSYPINNYNVTLNIAKYIHFSDIYTSEDGEKLDLDYYVLPDNLEKAKTQFEQVKPMLACYEKLFGKYPFWKDGFALVETPYLGMEHQSAVAYGNKYQNGYLGYDLSRSGYGMKFDYIIIHEAGHEYWGNSVSCKDHAELWIHESFCTYTEGLYVECMYGKEAGYTYIDGLRTQVGNSTPIVGPLGVNASGGADMYFKGALMLHTLRNVLNDDKLWFKIIKDIATDFKHKNTDTAEMIAYIGRKAGQDLKYFFEQYLYFTRIPTLEYKLNPQGEKTELSYRWKADAKGFQMPLMIQNGNGEIQIRPTDQWQTLLLSSPDLKLRDKAYYINLVQED